MVRRSVFSQLYWVWRVCNESTMSTVPGSMWCHLDKRCLHGN